MCFFASFLSGYFTPVPNEFPTTGLSELHLSDHSQPFFFGDGDNSLLVWGFTRRCFFKATTSFSGRKSSSYSHLQERLMPGFMARFFKPGLIRNQAGSWKTAARGFFLDGESAVVTMV